MGIGAFILVFALALLLGMPIAFAMLLASALYFTTNDADVLLQMLPERLFGGLDLFILLAIPMFLMAGDLMNRAGMSDRLITFANLLVGRLRGGLAQVNVLSSVLFSGVTGIALGDVVALGKIFIPAMERSGYSRSFAAAVTAASSLIGPIIPPSTIAVLYAAIMGVSVGGMFVAAIIPGLLIGLSDMIVVYLVARRRGYGVSSETVDRGKFLRSFRDALLAIVMPVIIIGGMLGGIFTPTEAAAVAVLYAAIMGVSVGGMFVAAIIPGLLIGLSDMIVVYLVARRR
ncbi:MAG: TRAP transporter large permease subunit, partial [Kiloniellales bacterium]|nr:TRAP transporter large permease subunit [Kiloniellales bacterium]